MSELSLTMNDKIQLLITPFNNKVEFLDYMKFAEKDEEEISLWTKMYQFLFEKESKIFLGSKGKLERGLEKLKNSKSSISFYDLLNSKK